MGDLEPKDIIFFLVYGLISISFGIYSLKFKEKAGAFLKKCNFGLFSNSFWEKMAIVLGLILLVFGIISILVSITQML